MLFKNIEIQFVIFALLRVVLFFFWSYLRTLWLIQSHGRSLLFSSGSLIFLAIAFKGYFPFLISAGFFIGISLNKDINWGWTAILTVLSLWIIINSFFLSNVMWYQCIYFKINFLLNWFLFLFELLFILMILLYMKFLS